MPIITLIIAIVALAALASLAWSGLSLIIWLPTKSKDLARVLKLADLKAGDFFYELGCGDGRISFYAAERSLAGVIGLELAWPLYAYCRIKHLFYPFKNLQFKCSDLFKEDLSGAKAVYVFGISNKLESKLRPKLERELARGCRVISYAFPIKGWTPLKIDRPGEKDISIFLYVR